MKKLVLMFAAVAAISFASCGNKAEGNAEGAEATDTVKDTIALGDTANVILTIVGADTLQNDTVKVEATEEAAPAEEVAEEATEAPVEEATEAPAEEAKAE